ncbi:hypothetical protein HZI73_11350 [Vallitalea pronyensis]|uniref:Ribbon-helix-helix protein CopG domain-containing protein n=1 Tax=Vallitalea pronyensis TaxID=1348613 RepID=A0A8J8MJR5_9FIRM|nr:CopG family transcriptional regulator [Vallitalea pronyensis]QUI22849.1 hypothetical protein HZI73_11350 [Vallitalea pronyensis]
MKKSIYSLVLLDDVVEAVDQLAYRKNTNRSQLINDLLAERLGLLTPRQQVMHVMERISDMVGNEQIQVKSKNDYGSLQFGTFIKYKYKPSIRYSFEFNVSNEHERYAVLKIQSRSKSEELNKHLDRFFNAMCYIDQKRFPEIYQREIINKTHVNSNNRFSREFLRGIPLDKVDDEAVAEYLSCYLLMMDHALNYYFGHYDHDNVFQQMDKIYCHHLGELELFIKK